MEEAKKILEPMLLQCVYLSSRGGAEFQVFCATVGTRVDPQPLLLYCQLVHAPGGVAERLKEAVLILHEGRTALSPATIDAIRAKAREWGVEGSQPPPSRQADAEA